MSNTALTRYIVTFHYQGSELSDILELTSAMTATGFTTTLADENGHPHELGTNCYGIVSTLTADDLKQQVTTTGESALGLKPEVSVMTFEEYRRDTADHHPSTSVPE